MRETAGDKWLTEIGALEREAFSKWLIIIIDRERRPIKVNKFRRWRDGYKGDELRDGGSRVI